MTINVFNQYGDMPIQVEPIIQSLEKVFSECFDSSLEVGLILVNEEAITKLNHDFRKLNQPTDVLSFPSDDDYLGDIFICVDKVMAQAQTYQHTMQREFAFLLCHGILHLLGYDHYNENDAIIMEAKQEDILNKTPYTRR